MFSDTLAPSRGGASRFTIQNDTGSGVGSGGGVEDDDAGESYVWVDVRTGREFLGDDLASSMDEDGDTCSASGVVCSPPRSDSWNPGYARRVHACGILLVAVGVVGLVIGVVSQFAYGAEHEMRQERFSGLTFSSSAAVALGLLHIHTRFLLSHLMFRAMPVFVCLMPRVVVSVQAYAAHGAPETSLLFSRGGWPAFVCICLASLDAGVLLLVLSNSLGCLACARVFETMLASVVVSACMTYTCIKIVSSRRKKNATAHQRLHTANAAAAAATAQDPKQQSVSLENGEIHAAV